MLWFVLVVQFYLLILRLEYGFEWGKKKTIKRMILDKVRFEWWENFDGVCVWCGVVNELWWRYVYSFSRRKPAHCYNDIEASGK